MHLLSVTLAVNAFLLTGVGLASFAAPSSLWNAAFFSKFQVDGLSAISNFLASLLGIALILMGLLSLGASVFKEEVLFQRCVCIFITAYATSNVLFGCYILSAQSSPVWILLGFGALLVFINSAGLMLNMLSDDDRKVDDPIPAISNSSVISIETSSSLDQPLLG